MVIGETAYTMPWALWLNEDRRCMLNVQYIVFPEAFGTIELVVKRTPEGYVIDASHTDYKWEPEADPGYIGGHSSLPVEDLLW
jgi:hypothetical protein